MIQRGGGARFTPEAFESLRVLGQVSRQTFHGNVAAKVQIFGFVANTHAATTELFDDAVVRDGLANEGCGIGRLAHISGCVGRQGNEDGHEDGLPTAARLDSEETL